MSDDPKTRPDIVVGCRIKFRREKRRYTVQARSDRFVICTKPLNLYHSVLYTIIDFERGERGASDRLFPKGFESREECVDRLGEMLREENPVRVSRRNCVELDIEAVLP